MRWIMMEGHEFADISYSCEVKGMAIAAMRIADTRSIFLFAVLGVIEKEIDIEREFMT